MSAEYAQGVADERARWEARYATLAAQARASEDRYFALLKAVADGVALLPRAPITVQLPAGHTLPGA